MSSQCPNFKASKADRMLIDLIVKRAVKFFKINDNEREPIEIEMDIIATHLNGNPLRLEDLLLANDFNFVHDIFGIYRHLDRTTGKLKDFFSPRYSAPKKLAVRS